MMNTAVKAPARPARVHTVTASTSDSLAGGLSVSVDVATFAKKVEAVEFARCLLEQGGLWRTLVTTYEERENVQLFATDPATVWETVGYVECRVRRY